MQGTALDMTAVETAPLNHALDATNALDMQLRCSQLLNSALGALNELDIQHRLHNLWEFLPPFIKLYLTILSKSR